MLSNYARTKTYLTRGADGTRLRQRDTAARFTFTRRAQAAGRPRRDQAALAKMRTDANDAIGRGADPAAVAKRFRELNGVELASVGNTFTMADAQHTAQLHNVPVAQVLQHMKAAGQRLVTN